MYVHNGLKFGFQQKRTTYALGG